MSENRNRRIAKNTMMLYVRLLLIMGVSLYSSRIVLSVLGVDDFGIYDVVGGAVAMFSFFSGSISVATQRFLSYELGKKDSGEIGKIFCMSVNTHLIMAAAAIVIVEAGGLWLLNHKLNIPADRIAAANWVFHCSVLSFIINFISIPYSALIIAHEKMSIYAYISIIDVILKLLIVYLLRYLMYDKLVLYAILLLAVSVIIRVAYGLYCRYKFTESHFKFVWDKGLFKQMFRHSNWMLLGTTTSMLSSQGVNMLMNTFFNVTVNAARGIAYQVYYAANSFIVNFMVAVQPQIIKLYVQEERQSMHRLIFTSSKFSFFLIFVIALPLVLEAEVVLKLWLGVPPEGAVLFTRLVVVDLLFSSLYTPIATLSQATGKIGLYQSVIGVGFLSVFLVTWLLYRLGFPAYSTFVVLVSVSFVTLFARLWILRKIADFPVKEYCVRVLLPILGVALSSLPLPMLLRFTVHGEFLRFGATLVSSVLATFSMVWMIGLNVGEKNVVKAKIVSLKHKFLNV